MMRRFNVTGSCIPERHYMVKLDDRLKSIKEQYIDCGSWFSINRGRQYGKTTTLRALENYLKEEYIVLSLDFQEIGTKKFADETTFSRAFSHKLCKAIQSAETRSEYKSVLLKALSGFNTDASDTGLDELFECLNDMCGSSFLPVVLMIDEVDSASNNQVFIDFLAQFRAQYLKRDKIPAFQSVILASVYNIKNLKQKMRPDMEHQYNSPWNVAEDFDMDMSFSVCEIASMLDEYESDHHTGMDIEVMAELIYQYTSGYPVLVSSICKYIDEMPAGDGCPDTPAWTKEGVVEAVKKLMTGNAPLFESMIRQINERPVLKKMLHSLLFEGKRITYNVDNPVIELAVMFGYIVNGAGTIQVANRIFEMRLYGYFLSEEELANAMYDEAQRNKNRYFSKGRLDMKLILEKFVQHYTDIYGENDEKFLEAYGRKLFLLYLKPIINGTGNYYVEAQTRDAKRTDVIVDYLGEQFIIELKIWRGNEYNERGEDQLADYLDYYHKDKGYLLSFNFNKKKTAGVREIRVGGRTIVEAVV